MIITHSKPYGVVKGMLKKWKKIGIVSCNSCARLCETGGKEKMEEIAERLKKDGYNVVDTDVVPMACAIGIVKKHEYLADTIVTLACDSGVATLQSLFPSKIIVAGCETIGIGARDFQGNIFLMRKI